MWEHGFSWNQKIIKNFRKIQAVAATQLKEEAVAKNPCLPKWCALRRGSVPLKAHDPLPLGEAGKSSLLLQLCCCYSLDFQGIHQGFLLPREPMLPHTPSL